MKDQQATHTHTHRQRTTPPTPTHAHTTKTTPKPPNEHLLQTLNDRNDLIVYLFV